MKIHLQNKSIFKTFLLIISLVFISCENQNNSVNSKLIEIKQKTQNINIENSKTADKANNIALFLSGADCEFFKEKQKKKYYKKHREIVDEVWKTIENETSEIKNWSLIELKEINSDSSVLFYPFSGPDILYANAFFPKHKICVMFGLENSGNLPDIENSNDEILEKYLENLRHALRFVNDKGYFVTRQMEKDFADKNMNGVLHIFLFYLAKMNCQITGVTNINIDIFGFAKDIDFVAIDDNKVNGLKINYVDKKSGENKMIIYFPIDVSNPNLIEKQEFMFFLNSLGSKNTFLKSASYLMQNDTFSIIRNFVINQSQYILQDDTGLPFNYLSKNFSYTFFGDYSRTMKIFESNFQPDLKEAVSKSTKHKLPFKIGYNSWYNEALIIYCKKNTENKNSKNDLIYKVQIKSSSRKIEKNADEFKNLPDVDYYFMNGLYRYTIGSFSTEAEAEKYRVLATENGYKDAFIAVFYNGKRITLDEAKKINR